MERETLEGVSQHQHYRIKPVQIVAEKSGLEQSLRSSDWQIELSLGLGKQKLSLQEGAVLV